MFVTVHLDLNYIQLFSVTAAKLLNMACTKVTKPSSNEIPSSTICGIGCNEDNIETFQIKRFRCRCSSADCCNPTLRDCPCIGLAMDCRSDCPCCTARNQRGALDNRRGHHFSQSLNSDVCYCSDTHHESDCVCCHRADHETDESECMCLSRCSP